MPEACYSISVVKTLWSPAITAPSRSIEACPIGPVQSVRFGSTCVAFQIGKCRCSASEPVWTGHALPAVAWVYLCGQNRVVISVSQAGEASTSAVSSRLS